MKKKPVKRSREQPVEEDDWVHPIGNDGSVACGVFLLLARRAVPGHVHPTQDLAMSALHMLWASVDVASSIEVARQSFQRLATAGALRLTNASRTHQVPTRSRSWIGDGLRAIVIVRVDTEGLTGVTEIGDGFLYNCHSLLTVNLRGFKEVTTVGSSFLCDCLKLKAVDLAPLARVTRLGDSFLLGCRTLTALDLAPLSQLTTLPMAFLADCTSLQSLDCRPLRSVAGVAGCFLFHCTALQELNVLSFNTVTEVGTYFLSDLPALRRLDLSSMANVTELYNKGLLGNHQLVSLTRPETGELATAAIAGF